MFSASALRRPRFGARFLSSAVRAFGIALCLRAEIEHLTPRQQREVALAWVRSH